MENQEAETEVLGHVVQVGFIEEDIPPEDVMVIFQRTVVRIYCGGALLFACPLYLNLSGSPFDTAFFNKFIPEEYGKPDKVSLVFEKGLDISQEVTTYCCIFEVATGE